MACKVCIYRFYNNLFISHYWLLGVNNMHFELKLIDVCFYDVPVLISIIPTNCTNGMYR